MRAWLILAALLLAPSAQGRPVLIEMFVSQSCSSCPPADALLQQLAGSDKDILPLSLNVTYWDNLGWRDTDALLDTTKRQFYYAGFANGTVYTPEAVVDGTMQLVGSDKRKLTAAIADAKASPAGNVPITISGGAMLSLDVAQGNGQGQIILYGYDSRHNTAVSSGENHGTVVSEINVVRSVLQLGPWTGWDEKFKLPRPAGEHVAVLLQAKDGSILGLGNE